MLNTETTHIHLKHCSKEVKDIIEREKARIRFEKNEELKQEYVIYEIIKEWRKFKDAHAQQISQS